MFPGMPMPVGGPLIPGGGMPGMGGMGLGSGFEPNEAFMMEMQRNKELKDIKELVQGELHRRLLARLERYALESAAHTEEMDALVSELEAGVHEDTLQHMEEVMKLMEHIKTLREQCEAMHIELPASLQKAATVATRNVTAAAEAAQLEAAAQLDAGA
eukprot:TRINITY_DN8428_c0_g1_i2.p1 TRINITY_DN8428_c0_g1~~TRINITY_DN8428_c0_g1_i2.p1  ORF type:complete len:158 (+),score=58.23 TRINITY_DN8428_c0_g1_i2:60-533(+)